MSYKSLQQCIANLEKKGEIKIISDEVNPDLDMASIHLNEFEKGGKAIFFENIKGSKYKAVSNLFGTLDRSKFMFRDSLEIVKQLIELKTNPISALKTPVKSLFTALNGVYSIPKKVSFPRSFKEIQIEDIPQIICWKEDGGAFITLPQVYSEDVENPRIMNANLGMYRITAAKV
jgi:4-hydroxy-3-polyprenylbenzoate decarboxylase